MPVCFCPDSWIPNLVNAGLLLRSKSAASSFIPDDNSILAFFILMVRFILLYTFGKVHPSLYTYYRKIYTWLISQSNLVSQASWEIKMFIFPQNSLGYFNSKCVLKLNIYWGLCFHSCLYTVDFHTLTDPDFLCFQAVSNPLQAVLAALVFWGLPNTNQLRLNIFSQSEVGYGSSSGSSIINRSGLSAHSGLSTGSESEPLISYRQKTMF